MDRLVAGLRRILGSRVKFSDSEVGAYSRDSSFIKPQRPIAVAFPSDVGEISRVLKFCNSNGIKVTPRGGGSSLTGASVPLSGGIVMSMERFNRILEVNVTDQYAVAEPGVTIDELNRRLGRHGYFYPPDPGSSSRATIGGSISTNAGGLSGVMYGSTKRWVLSVQAVMADGSVIDTGSRTLKLSRGYDLTSLIIGSEGTLGVITKAVLRIEPRRGSLGYILAHYSSMGTACDMLSKLKGSGIPLITAEFLDLDSMRYMEACGAIRIPTGSKYMVMVGISADSTSITVEMDKAFGLVRRHKPLKAQLFTKRRDVDGIYSSRKGLHGMMTEECKRSGLEIIIGDVVVPLSELDSALAEMNKVSGRSWLKVVVFGHMGEGNIHLNIFADVNERKSLDEARRLLDRFGTIAIRHGGSVSAEHGIGLEKKSLLIEELKASGSSMELGIMKDIKKAFDPKGILNPGKIFD